MGVQAVRPALIPFYPAPNEILGPLSVHAGDGLRIQLTGCHRVFTYLSNRSENRRSNSLLSLKLGPDVLSREGCARAR